jgi:hypothetical protein
MLLPGDDLAARREAVLLIPVMMASRISVDPSSEEWNDV